MPKPRFSGGTCRCADSSSQMLPPESCIRPAMQLSAVDLPQPEGPTAMNSPPTVSASAAGSSVHRRHRPQRGANLPWTASKCQVRVDCAWRGSASRSPWVHGCSVVPNSLLTERLAVWILTHEPALLAPPDAIPSQRRPFRLSGREAAPAAGDRGLGASLWSSALRHSWSQLLNAPRPAPCPGSSGWVCGNWVSHPSYSGRPNSLNYVPAPP